MVSGFGRVWSSVLRYERCFCASLSLLPWFLGAWNAAFPFILWAEDTCFIFTPAQMDGFTVG